MRPPALCQDRLSATPTPGDISSDLRARNAAGGAGSEEWWKDAASLAGASFGPDRLQEAPRSSARDGVILALVARLRGATTFHHLTGGDKARPGFDCVSLRVEGPGAGLRRLRFEFSDRERVPQFGERRLTGVFDVRHVRLLRKSAAED